MYYGIFKSLYFETHQQNSSMPISTTGYFNQKARLPTKSNDLLP